MDGKIKEMEETLSTLKATVKGQAATIAALQARPTLQQLQQMVADAEAKLTEKKALVEKIEGKDPAAAAKLVSDEELGQIRGDHARYLVSIGF